MKARFLAAADSAMQAFGDTTNSADRDILKYLLAVNAGGALALLALVKDRPAIAGLPIAFFGLGILCVGILTCLISWRKRDAYKQISGKYREFLRGDVTEGTLHDFGLTVGRDWTCCLLVLLLGISFVCFVGGSWTAYTVLSNQAVSPPPSTQIPAGPVGPR